MRIPIGSAVAVYWRVAILKKRLPLEASRDTGLQISSRTLFEKTPLSQALAQLPPSSEPHKITPVYQASKPDTTDGVYYLIQANEVWVLAVLHGAREVKTLVLGRKTKA